MKNKLSLIIASIAALVIGAGVYVYFTFFNGIDFAQNVPKNAVIVMKADVMGMASKIDFKENNQTSSMKNELMKNLTSSQKKMIEDISSNPLKSGIKFASEPTMCLFNANSAKESAVVAFMFGISDPKDFKSALTEISKDINIKDADPSGFYEVIIPYSDDFVIYFNDSMGIILSDIDNKGIDLKSVRDQMVGLKSDESILSKEDYKSLDKQSNDLMAYFSMDELINAVAINNRNEKDLKIMRNISKALPFGYTLNFEEDAIALKVIGSENQESSLGSFYNEDGFSNDDLKNIDPKGTPLAYLTMGLNFKKMMNFVIEQSKYQGNSEIDNQINQAASSLQLTRDELLNLVGGKASLALSEIHVGDNSYENPTKPVLNFWMTLGDKNAAKKILDLATNNGQLILDQGIYTENNPYRGPQYFVALIEDNLYFSTQKDPILQKLQKKEWAEIDEEHGGKDVTSNSMSMYMSLDYSSYKDIMRSQMNEYQFNALNKFQSILSSFKSLNIHGKNNEVEMILQFKEKNTNSLQRIIELLQEAYQIAS